MGGVGPPASALGWDALGGCLNDANVETSDEYMLIHMHDRLR